MSELATFIRGLHIAINIIFLVFSHSLYDVCTSVSNYKYLYLPF